MSTQVLHVIARMNIGGTAQYVNELINKIPNSKLATGYVQGCEIEDACVQRLHALRVPHLGRKISPINDFRAWSELRKIVNEIKPKIIHTHTFKAGLIGRLVGGNHLRVHTYHGHLFDDLSFNKLEKIVITFVEKYLANRTDMLISVGRKVGIELRRQGIGRNKNWMSISPGVDALAQFEKMEARKLLAIESNEVLVGWLARMEEVKNPRLLLEVAKLMPSVSFVMAGGGSLFESIKNAAPKNVIVIGWTNASQFWSAVDLGISTSDNEGMPVALIEAQLSGVPVIATNVGSTEEVIKNGSTGILVDKNIGELISAVKTLVENEVLRNLMGKSAEINSLAEFSPNKMLQEHRHLYDNLANSERNVRQWQVKYAKKPKAN